MEVTSPELSDLVRRCLPPRLHDVSQATSRDAVSVFIDKTVDLLVSEELAVREVSKDALGQELSPSAFPALLRSLDT